MILVERIQLHVDEEATPEKMMTKVMAADVAVNVVAVLMMIECDGAVVAVVKDVDDDDDDDGVGVEPK